LSGIEGPFRPGFAARLRKRPWPSERDVPAYIVFSDVSLRQMARRIPVPTGREMERISGVGQRKLEEFGGTFMVEIADYLRTYPRQTFVASAAAPVRPKPVKSDTVAESLRRFQSGQTVERIAKERDMATGTILGHLAIAIETGERLQSTGFSAPRRARNCPPLSLKPELKGSAPPRNCWVIVSTTASSASFRPNTETGRH